MSEQYPLTEILNNDERIFSSWATVDIIDKHGERIPIEEFKPILPIMFKRGADIMDSHSNKKVGKWINYQFKDKDGIPALLLTGIINRDYKLDDLVWNNILNGKYSGTSFGGSALKRESGFYKGKPEHLLKELEGYEFSVVEKPANQGATMETINYIAKAEGEKLTSKAFLETVSKPFAGFTNFDDCVRQSKEKENPSAYCATIMHKVEETDKEFEQPELITNDTSKEEKIMADKKKQEEPMAEEENSLEARVAAIEQMLQEFMASQKADEEKKPEEEKEEDEEEEKKPEEETEKAEDGAGEKPVNPSPEGGEVKLPKTVSEEVAEEEAGTAETDQVSITEKKITKLQKDMLEIKKSVALKAGTPRPSVEVKKSNKDYALQIARGETKFSNYEFNKAFQEEEEKLMGKILNRG